MTEEDLRQLGVALLNSPAEAIVYSDREGLIRFWNGGAERVFGFTAEEALGQSLDIIIPERQRQRHWEGYDEVMKTGVSRYGSGDLLSVPALRKDGSRISVEFTIVPLKDADGAMLGMASVMRDVSARFEELKTLRRQAAGR
ncbi:PAS domain S-box protein [Azospirillum sp. 11R-A]|uniref:PAS sensor domain-containing protein n=1 Tax=Azospirillum palustre TaxID=2044885 RepID=A0A2B8BAA9_9PROT|nr:PAS domain S-box protein [Azospirillum palustre]PGH55666.1 PAS sensor domain-containing protein [Azospirillum palustre]